MSTSSKTRAPRAPIAACDPKVEELSGNTRGTLATLRGQKRGPPFYKTPSGRVLYDSDELIAWRRSRESLRRVEPKADEAKPSRKQAGRVESLTGRRGVT